MELANLVVSIYGQKIRPLKVTAGALGGGFHSFVHRCLHLSLGSKLRTVWWAHVHSIFSVGKSDSTRWGRSEVSPAKRQFPDSGRINVKPRRSWCS